MMERAEVNRLLGVDSRVVYPDEIKQLCPQLDTSDHPTFPILAALYHPPGGIIRHDAVVWGYAKEAAKLGVEIHPYTQVTAINRSGGRVTGVDTNRGTIAADTVVSCVSGWSTQVADLAGVPLPITTHILQACVTEPVKPLLHRIIVSGTLHIYISQSDRGEFVMGVGDRALLRLLGQGHLPLHRGPGDAHDRAAADARERPHPAPVDRPVRRLAGLFADHGRDRDGGISDRRRLGHIRLQGLADRRQDDGRTGRHQAHPGPDRPLPAGALLRERTGLGAGRRGRVPLNHRRKEQQ